MAVKTSSWSTNRKYLWARREAGQLTLVGHRGVFLLLTDKVQPITATSLRDAIAQADCGQTFDVDDAAGLTAFLTALADDPAERTRLGANAQTAFEQHYQPQICCQQWLPLLETLTQQNNNDK